MADCGTARGSSRTSSVVFATQSATWFIFWRWAVGSTGLDPIEATDRVIDGAVDGGMVDAAQGPVETLVPTEQEAVPDVEID